MPSIPENVLSNGDVEEGLAPWVARGGAQIARSTSVFRNGNHSVSVTNRSASWHGASYPIQYLTPGNTYGFSAWVRLSSGEASTNAKLTVQMTDEAGVQYIAVGSVRADSDGWSVIEGDYVHAPSGTVEELAVYVEAERASASYYVDDLVLTGTIAPPLQPPGGGDITVNTSISYQTIDGFGAALPMWVSSEAGMLSADEVRTLVGMGDGELGLSIIRTIISPSTDSWPFAVANLQEAQEYATEVQVLATPGSYESQRQYNRRRQVTAGCLRRLRLSLERLCGST